MQSRGRLLRLLPLPYQSPGLQTQRSHHRRIQHSLCRYSGAPANRDTAAPADGHSGASADGHSGAFADGHAAAPADGHSGTPANRYAGASSDRYAAAPANSNETAVLANRNGQLIRCLVVARVWRIQKPVSLEVDWFS